MDWKDSTFITYADVFDRWELFIASDELYPLIDSSVASSHDINADYQYVTSEEAVLDTQISSDLSITSIDLFGNSSGTRIITQSLICYHLILQFYLMNFLTQLFSTPRPNCWIYSSWLAEPLGQVFIRLGYSTWTVDIDQDGHWYFELPTSSVPFDSTSNQFELTVIDVSGNYSEVVTIPVIVDTKAPSLLTVDGVLFGDNAISPDDMLSPLVIRGLTSLDTTLVELDIFIAVYSTVPESDGTWSFDLDSSSVPDISRHLLRLVAVDEHNNRLTNVHDFVVAMETPEPPVFKAISNDGFLNYRDSFYDVAVEGSAAPDHHIMVNYRDRLYHAKLMTVFNSRPIPC